MMVMTTMRMMFCCRAVFDGVMLCDVVVGIYSAVVLTDHEVVT